MAIIEQGTRDALQLAINALERARDATGADLFPVVDNIDTALLEIGTALQIQKVEYKDTEGFVTQEDMHSLQNNKSVMKSANNPPFIRK